MPKSLRPIARLLRSDVTNAEQHLWEGLRRKQLAGFRFRRQVILDGFIADFAAFDARLVVEVDGATHSTHQQMAYDAARSAALAARGFAVLRFANDDVYRNLDGVLETIRMKLTELRPRRGTRGLSSAQPPAQKGVRKNAILTTGYARPRKGGGRATVSPSRSGAGRRSASSTARSLSSPAGAPGSALRSPAPSPGRARGSRSPGAPGRR